MGIASSVGASRVRYTEAKIKKKRRIEIKDTGKIIEIRPY